MRQGFTEPHEMVLACTVKPSLLIHYHHHPLISLISSNTFNSLYLLDNREPLLPQFLINLHYLHYHEERNNRSMQTFIHYKNVL